MRRRSRCANCYVCDVERCPMRQEAGAQVAAEDHRGARTDLPAAADADPQRDIDLAAGDDQEKQAG